MDLSHWQGLSEGDLREAVRRALPLLRVLATITANKVDDALVVGLQAWLDAGHRSGELLPAPKG